MSWSKIGYYITAFNYDIYKYKHPHSHSHHGWYRAFDKTKKY